MASEVLFFFAARQGAGASTRAAADPDLGRDDGDPMDRAGDHSRPPSCSCCSASRWPATTPPSCGQHRRAPATAKTPAIALYARALLSGGVFMFASIQLGGALYRHYAPGGFLVMALCALGALPAPRAGAAAADWKRRRRRRQRRFRRPQAVQPRACPPARAFLAGARAMVAHPPIGAVADATGLADHQVGRDQAGLQRVGVFACRYGLGSGRRPFRPPCASASGPSHPRSRTARTSRAARRDGRRLERGATVDGPARPACPARPGARASAPAPAPSAGRRGAPGRRAAAVLARRAVQLSSRSQDSSVSWRIRRARSCRFSLSSRSMRPACALSSRLLQCDCTRRRPRASCAHSPAGIRRKKDPSRTPAAGRRAARRTACAAGHGRHYK